jgi:hypothetical protein
MKKSTATKFIVFITMQYKENYGAHAWEGEGECPQYWKFKGGSDYISRELSLSEVQEGGVDEFAQSVIDSISYKDDYSSEHVVDWELKTVKDYKKEQRQEEKEYNDSGYGPYIWPEKASDRADQLEERKAS